MDTKKTTLSNFKVYKLVNGQWAFWMNARGRSAVQLRHSIWWLNQGKVPKDHIKVEPADVVPDLHP